MDLRAERIEVLIEALGAVLGGLDADSAELGSEGDPVMAACEQAFARYQEEDQRLAGVERPEALKLRIRHAIKLHAMLGSGVSQERERIGGSLDGSAARKQFREAYKKPPRLGESCDMAG